MNVGNSPTVRRQLISEFTVIVRKILQAMGFDLWNRKTTEVVLTIFFVTKWSECPKWF